jgi:pimeloyl-ACP methyl ester carboxylesterase
VNLVLLHGLGIGPIGWRPQVEVFSPEMHVVAPELIGFGISEGSFSFDGARQQVVRILADLPPGPTILCGLSLGALVALDIATSHHAAVDALIVCAGFASLPEELRVQQLAMARQLDELDVDAFAGVLPQLATGLPVEFQTRATESLAYVTKERLASVFTAVAAFNARPYLERYSKPTLVLCGGDDSLNQPLSRDLASGLTNAVYVEIPDAGHAVNLDQPIAFNTAVTAFIQGLS